MVLSKEQAQTRFLAIVLPTLTLCTHTLLAFSFALPGSEQYRAFWSLVYNSLAACASILGLIGAVRLIPSFVSAYTFVHTTALSFVTLALVNIIVPFDAGFLNPVIPSWHVDESAICRDIDAGFGWDEEWLVKCSKHFYTRNASRCVERVAPDVCAMVGTMDRSAMGQGTEVPEIEGQSGCREAGLAGRKERFYEGRKDTSLGMEYK
ncbi:hypothetical protein SNOG_12821 [Parastagonospora nodorum SN15]|uniref:Uncharacterized protein n=1 Tax=Phaeosphaeria nodorum (strain SN15 / ATCC MYA-4574 / FGSC 10173) TaxID=321614 RepID=Q0U5Z3_PHANO|nr:hypothetical protein SNOG_12821 [Parastagonospora nodorum SN15]EAT79621.2 hypothetical protein SNOG_12821 [Parastagonospora nodorum SN15]